MGRRKRERIVLFFLLTSKRKYDIIRYNKKETSIKYGQNLLEEALALGDSLKDKEYLDLRTNFLYEVRKVIEEIMDKKSLT